MQRGGAQAEYRGQRALAPARRAAGGQGDAREAGEMTPQAPQAHRCGTVGIAGRPNTGKSSLLNRLVGQKLSIVSAKPQTTRHLLNGILTRPGCQYVFVDSPGVPSEPKSVLHRALNRRATEAARDVDVAVFVVEATRFTPEDRAALERMPEGQKVIAAGNKIDLVRSHADLIPFLDRLAKSYTFEAVVTVSA